MVHHTSVSSRRFEILCTLPDTKAGVYSPPKDCKFTTTIFNISVTSHGRQYDRLALLFLGDIEVWRTSTAMPIDVGIYWSYQKDMTTFDTILKIEHRVIFDLSNVYSDLYTGAYNVALEALYYNDQYVPDLSPADHILPISALASSKNISSVMSLPDDNGTVSVQFPRNVKAATVSVLASGNSAEEFWYTNVPTEYVNTFPENPGWLYSYSPFREIQVLIDGKLAGVSWPFPLLFTGGVDPGLWRPIVGIDAFDLPSFDVDVTPWLPLLCDGKLHNFSLKVVSFDTSASGNIGSVGENWWVTGAVFIWLDEHGNQTRGSVSLSRFFHLRPTDSNLGAGHRK
jgi:Peptide N-acetyl-beta-D-glucosaminyl asparaginase amidase A